MDKKDFEAKFNALDTVEQEIVQVVALISEPSGITQLLKCIHACGFLRELRVEDRRRAVRDLENHFIDNFENKLFINRDIINFIVKDYCLKNPAFDLYRSQIASMYPAKKEGYYGWKPEYNIDRLVRDFRVAFFSDDKKSIEELIKLYNNSSQRGRERHGLYFELFHSRFSTELIRQVPDEHKFWILEVFYWKKSVKEVISYIEGNGCNIQNASVKSEMFHKLADHYLACGKLEKLDRLIKSEDIPPGFYAPTIEFLHGNTANANKLYISEIQNKLGRSKRMYCPPKIHGAYFSLSMLAANELENPFLLSAINKGGKEGYGIYYVLQAYVASKSGEETSIGPKLNHYRFLANEIPVVCLLMWMIDKELINENKMRTLTGPEAAAARMNCEYLDYQYHTVLSLINKNYEVSDDEKNKFAKLGKKYLDLSTLFKIEEEWKKSLTLLKNIAQGSGAKKNKVAKGQSERLVWFAQYHGSGFYFYPKEQVIRKNGKWSGGRPVALKRLMQNDVKCMSSIDQQIATCISEERFSTWGRYYEIQHKLDSDRAMPFFMKHPYLFLADSPATPMELLKEETQLIVKKKGRNFEISFSHSFESEGVEIIRETPSRFRIVQITDTEMRIAKALGKEHKLVIPKDAETDLKSIISGLSAMITIHSDIKGGGSTKIISVKADTKPHIHLLPVGEGIRAEFFVRPFTKSGQYCKPGQGGLTVISEIKGKQKQASRNFSKEKESAENIINQCPSLASRGSYNDILNFETPDECLEALLELQDVKDDVAMEWPEGEKLRVGRKYSMSDMNVAVTKSDDWFEMDASLQINEKTILSMEQLLQKVSHSRFIELNNGEFIALTNDLKHKLESLSEYTYSSKGKSKIHPLNVLAIDELLGDIEANFDKHWKKQLKKAEDSLSFQPKLPSTFQADLRPYQLDGYKWLSRLANWGVGACLADDMGLGKTIQALAVILERAIEGPTLVVAPASVCINWINEANKFTPTLNTILFGSGVRKDVLDDLKSFDLVVCSYGLLLHESELISEVQWSTTVLDEAQAIKNFKAKRTKAALNLKSDFKLITTGTPVENHLSEFWTLFSFINPGLLGSQREFSAKFAVPIERDNDKKIRNSLKKIVRPFLLRRIKAHVLDELPPKTEINISVEMSSEENAFYEALRRNSVAQIDSMKDQKGGAVHLRILAELTKLRRACCHSTLITKESKIESSKLQIFTDIVNELIENTHKALVFSQFTSYLAIIRETCDRLGIKYQYLDGSTPIKERQRRVDAFQAGEGDIFLISLKAGGMGLNLTAADYVIHMDPWWNPAVEDQASDRAHRIGQQHPVTVYRLVTKGTVEEKIISLHKRKRELVDSLLDGADVSGKMSAEDLLNLIK